MRADRFENTEPWGFSPDASGVRTRPDLEMEIAAATLRLDERAAAQPSPRTARLAPAKAATTAHLRPVPAPEPRPSTQPLTRPIRALAQPASSPPALALVPPPKAEPPLEAAVHASVYASVQAVLLAASHLPKVAAPAAPAPVSDGWTPAQRIYVLVTAVALSVMATTIVFLTMGSADVHGAQVPRIAHVSAPAVAILDTSVGSVARKDVPPLVAAATSTPLPPAPRRAAGPATSSGRTASNGALSTTAGGGTSAGSAPSATKLDDAARSARMLREQLNSAVN